MHLESPCRVHVHHPLLSMSFLRFPAVATCSEMSIPCFLPNYELENLMLAYAYLSHLFRNAIAVYTNIVCSLSGTWLEFLPKTEHISTYICNRLIQAIILLRFSGSGLGLTSNFLYWLNSKSGKPGWAVTVTSTGDWSNFIPIFGRKMTARRKSKAKAGPKSSKSKINKVSKKVEEVVDGLETESPLEQPDPEQPQELPLLPVVEVMTCFNQRSTEGRVVINPPQSKWFPAIRYT